MSVIHKVAVIGSNSFSGSDFIDLLLEEGRYSVVGVSRSPEKHHLFLPYTSHADAPFRFCQMDLNTDMNSLIGLLDSFEPEFIVNFAAQSEVAPSWEHPEQWFQTNAVSLARLGNALKDRSYLKRYVHISSPEVYGSCTGTVTETAPLNPSTPYAASKAAADLFLSTLVQNFEFPLVTIRATNVYGACQQLFKIIPRTAICLKTDKTLSLHGGGVAVKSYIHIRSYLKRYVHTSSPEVYGSCTGTVTETAPLNPSTPYAASKAAADLFLSTLFQNFEFPLVTIRATNVYGACQQLFKIIPRTAICLKTDKTLSLHGGGTAVKSYIHIRDVSRGELAAMESGQTGSLYHLSPDQGHAVCDVVGRVTVLRGCIEDCRSRQTCRGRSV